MKERRFKVKEGKALFARAWVLLFAGLCFLCLAASSDNVQAATTYSRVDSAKISSIENTKNGPFIKWDKMKKVDAYLIFRRSPDTGKWTRIKIIGDRERLHYTDSKSLATGKEYRYVVIGCKKSSQGGTIRKGSDKTTANVWLSPVTIKSYSSPVLLSASMKWDKVKRAGGYTIQYGDDPVFLAYKTRTMKKGSAGGASLKKEKITDPCYARIRAFKKVNGKTYTSAWSYSPNLSKEVSVKTVYKKKNKKYLEYRELSEQKLYSYDTFQGCTSVGKYMYCTLYNRKVEKFKIAKIDLKTGKVVQVSKKIFTGHGNGMTYNSKEKVIVATYKLKSALRVSIINPKTLKLKKVKKIILPKRFKSKIKGISAIAYNAKRNRYAAIVSGTKRIAILDKNFFVETYYTPTKKFNYLNQDIECTNDLVMHVQSPKGQKYNIMACYDWKGNFVSKVYMNKNYELESVCKYNKKVYGAVYRAYFKKVTVTVTKKKKVDGKTKKVKVKEEKKVWTRDNNIINTVN